MSRRASEGQNVRGRAHREKTAAAQQVQLTQAGVDLNKGGVRPKLGGWGNPISFLEAGQRFEARAITVADGAPGVAQVFTPCRGAPGVSCGDRKV